MTLETTPERTLQLLQKAVEERGEDYIYPDEWKGGAEENMGTGTCRYVTPDHSGPACIAGFVFHEYGMTLEELLTHEGQAAWKIADEAGVDDLSRTLLGAAQAIQDRGDSWGRALENARSEYTFAQRYTREKVSVD